jgi:hypothetical protein
MTDQIYTKLDQDVELSSAIGKFKNSPNELQQYLQTQLDKVFKDVTTQKDSTFQKVYGNLTQSVKSQESNIMYNNRNMEISKLNKNTYDTQKKNANNIKQDKDLYNRKYEMNEWSVNNAKDTLFVFSMLFIMLSGLLFITGLWRLNLLSTSLWVLLSIPMIIIFIITVIYRSQYTNVFRNKRYWNRKIFEGKNVNGKVPVPLCPGALSGLESEFSSAENDISSDISSLSKEASDASQYVSKEALDASQYVSKEASQSQQYMSTTF